MWCLWGMGFVSGTVGKFMGVGFVEGGVGFVGGTVGVMRGLWRDSSGDFVGVGETNEVGGLCGRGRSSAPLPWHTAPSLPHSSSRQ